MTLPKATTTTVPFYATVLAFLAAHASFVRGVETFLFVLLGAFVANVAALGAPPDLTTLTGWQQVSTALVSAVLVAINHWRITSGPAGS